MYAITPKGIGKKVGARAIRNTWELAEGETFKAEDFNADMVLAEDGISLREPTAEELAPTYQELRQADLPSIGDQMDMQYWDAINGTTLWKDMITGVKTKHPKVAK